MYCLENKNEGFQKIQGVFSFNKLTNKEALKLIHLYSTFVQPENRCSLDVVEQRRNTSKKKKREDGKRR